MLSASSTQQLLTYGKKIVCIGRNYVEHARELGNAVPTQPFFFLKPTTSYIRSGSNIEIPRQSTDIHHEIELGVVIGTKGKNVPEDHAMSLVRGYILALDVTDRGLQKEAKKAGKPWTTSKGFDTFCPISDSMVLVAATTTSTRTATSTTCISPDAQQLRLWCNVNGQRRQEGSIADMIFPIPTLISSISRVMTLEEHDVILTGTPPGVGPIRPGDVVEAGLCRMGDNDNVLLQMKFNVVVAKD